jgi:hypothetical protein
MKVLKFDEQPDGSAIIEVEITEEENQFFIEYAVTNIIKEQIERTRNEDNLCTPVSE